ncbi:MAG: hypothetical protein JAY68_18570 [Candidatus Thiodiazotropha taylori]|nr:hypothetical protein [Candidatus Thiodiazotropha taylori]
MSITWGNWDVRVYAAQAWVSLASRFAMEQPTIIDKIEAILTDPAPAVRVQVAQNLHVIHDTAPERMWTLGNNIATRETDIQVITDYLNRSLWHFGHQEPESCERVLSIVKDRFDSGLGSNDDRCIHLKKSLGKWTAQLFARKGRELTRTWLEEWATDTEKYGDILDSFTRSMRSAFYYRYRTTTDPKSSAVCDRAHQGLALILAQATTISAEAYKVLISDVTETDKQAARNLYSSAEKVIGKALDELYFGSGAYADPHKNPGLPDTTSKAQFLKDYNEILAWLATSHEPATQHRLIELYEYLIPGDPVRVFEAIHEILFGKGKEEGYHYERLAQTTVVRIVQRYIADHRGIFEDEDRRRKLVAILQLFSDSGWTDALKLLYDLPDLLR